MKKKNEIELTPAEIDNQKTGAKFYSGGRQRFIPELSDGMNVDLSVAQRILGKGAPLTTFGNPAIDDLLRDNWSLFYFSDPSFKEYPPEGREINRRLIEYFTQDSQWNEYHIFFANRKVASAAAAVVLTEKMLQVREAAEAMAEQSAAEQCQERANQLRIYVQGGDYPDDGDGENEDGEGDGYGDDDDGDDDDGDGQSSMFDDDNDNDENDEDGQGQSKQPKMSRDEAEAEAEQQEAEAQGHQEKSEHAMDSFENKYFSGVQRSAAVKKAGEFGEDVSVFMQSWGMDEGDGYELSIEEIRAIMSLMGNGKIMQLTNLMGRFYGIASHALAGRAPVQIFNAGAGLTRFIPNLFPEEVARLSPLVHPEIRRQGLEDYVINGMTGLTQVSEAMREGAFIFAVDKSGSMESPFDEKSSRDVIAAALSLGLAQAAKQNFQPFRGFGFGSGRELTDIVNEITPVNQLITFATSNFGGGTDFIEAMNFALDIFDSLDELDKQGTDILFITDGQSSVDEDVTDRLMKYKEQYGVRLWVLLLSASSSNSIEKIADKVLPMTDADVMAETLANLIFVDE